jgi:hypothetical protein
MKNDKEAIKNGSKLVKALHVFIEGKGCFFPSMAEALKQGDLKNGVGLVTEKISFEGDDWFQCNSTNVFD